MKKTCLFFLVSLMMIVLCSCTTNQKTVNEIEMTTSEAVKPVFLEYYGETKNEVFSRCKIDGNNTKISDEGRCLLVNYIVRFGDYDFSVYLDFSRTDGALYGIEYSIESTELTKDEIFYLTRLISSSLNEAYGEPKTASTNRLSNWQSSEDVELSKKSIERWLVPGIWPIEGEKDEDIVMCAELSYIEYDFLEKGKNLKPYILLSFKPILHPLSSYEKEFGILF